MAQRDQRIVNGSRGATAKLVVQQFSCIEVDAIAARNADAHLAVVDRECRAEPLGMIADAAYATGWMPFPCGSQEALDVADNPIARQRDRSDAMGISH